MDRVGAADVGDAGLGEPEESDLTLLHKIADSAGNIFDRDGRIDAMLIEEVNVICAKPSQATIDRRTDCLRPAVPLQANLFSSLDAKTKLGGNDYPVAPVLECAAEQVLVGERAIDLRGVEERASQLNGAMKRCNRLCLIRRTVRLAHAHASESDCGDFKSLTAKFAFA